MGTLLEEYPLLAWAFGGVGVTITGILLKTIYTIYFNPPSEIVTVARPNTNTVSPSGNTVSLNIYNQQDSSNKTLSESVEAMSDAESYNEKKNITKILFIDDEVKFKVVKILQNAGWIHTKLIKDARSLDQPEINEANIIFVDVQGVGVELNFKEEGLGLASALKNKYPNKKIIIYSAEQTGDRFHKTLREVDDFLPKDADPYQFQSVVERFA